MIPLYGFLHGDTIGLLMLASEDETVADLAERLQRSASVRVAHRPAVKLLRGGRVVDPRAKVAEAGFQALDRFDVVPAASGERGGGGEGP